jgi:hypothetical protein
VLLKVGTADVSQEHAASIFRYEVHFDLKNGGSMDAFIFIYFFVPAIDNTAHFNMVQIPKIRINAKFMLF